MTKLPLKIYVWWSFISTFCLGQEVGDWAWDKDGRMKFPTFNGSLTKSSREFNRTVTVPYALVNSSFHLIVESRVSIQTNTQSGAVTTQILPAAQQHGGLVIIQIEANIL